jgi:polyribonucleotide nucleotidyltransferase
VKEVKDELREGDQVMVKVLAIEGNRIKLSRKALIKEQKAKLGQSAPAQSEETEFSQPTVQDAPVRSPRSSAPRNEFDERQPSSNQSTILIEGGDDFDEDGGGVEIDETNEPNFNRVDGAPVVHAGGPPFAGGTRPGGAGANNNRRRRRRGGRRPGGGQG